MSVTPIHVWGSWKGQPWWTEETSRQEFLLIKYDLGLPTYADYAVVECLTGDIGESGHRQRFAFRHDLLYVHPDGDDLYEQKEALC